MIEPTDEMERAFEETAEPCCSCGDTRAGLAAVLAIVERDYSIARRPPERCGSRGFAGSVGCQRKPGHDGSHRWSLDDADMTW